MRFTTINSDLFAKAKETQIPEWLENMPTDFEKPTMELEFDKTAAWADKQTVQRDERDYTPKQVVAKLNNNEIILAKTELAKFLKNKHYTIKTANLNSDVVTLTTNISNIPGEFDFMFSKQDGKIKLASTFEYNKEFYPFNEAGFKECVADIDIHNPIAQKVNADKASIISLEEIIRRYNGHIRPATDRINELLKEGSIVGVTSNSYGTFLDVDYLFPQQQREQLSSKAPEFEFVQNMEKIATTEKKSAYQLAMEASKQFSQKYDDFKITAYKRKGDKLYVKANVLQNNHTVIANFKFNIENEKIVKRDMPDITASKMDMFKKQSRIYKDNIIDEQYLVTLLKENGYFNVNVKSIIAKLQNDNLITPVANGKYTSNYSLNQLLKTAQSLLPKQNKTKLAKVTDKVKDLRMNREQIKDTGVRETEELVSEQTLLNAINEFLIKYFNTYEIVSYNITQSEQDHKTFIDTNIKVFSESTGLEIIINLYFVCEYNQIVNYTVSIDGNSTTIEEVQEAYDINQALTNYLDEKTAKRVKSNIIFTKQGFFDKLSRVAKVDRKSIQNTLDLLCKQDKIQHIAEDKYASKFTLEQLINISNVNGFSKAEIRQNIVNAQYNKTKRLGGIYTQDTGDREIVDIWSDNEVELYISNIISRIFTIFNIEQITRNNDEYNVAISAVDEDGITKPMAVIFDIQNNHPNEITQIVKPGINDTVQEYLIVNKPNLYNAKGIITQKQLENSLLDVVDIPEIESSIKLLLDNVLIEPLFEDKFKVNTTMSEIVAFLDKNKKTNITANKTRRKEAVRQTQVTDSITVFDNDTRDVEYIMTDEELYYYILDVLSTQFDYIDDIIEIEERDDSWFVRFMAVDVDGVLKEVTALFSKAGENPEDLLEITKDGVSEIVQEYIDIYEPNTYNLQGIISKNQLQTILDDFVDDVSVQDCLELLLDNDIIEILADNKFKTKTTLSSIVDFLGKKGKISKRKIQAKKEQRKQATRIAQVTDGPNTFDNDTREMVDIMSTEEQELYIKQKLNKFFNNFTINSFGYENDTYEVTFTAIDKDGVEKCMQAYFNYDEFKNPEEIIRIEKPKTEDEVLEYLSYEKANQEGSLGCMSYNQLKTKLSPVVDVNDFQNILPILINKGLIEPLNDNEFAIKTTMSYIVQVLKDTNKTDITANKNKLKKAVAENSIKQAKHIKETESRKLENEQILTLAGQKAQQHLLKEAGYMYDNKKLTLRKYMQVKARLKEATTERQLDEVAKILNEYK